MMAQRRPRISWEMLLPISRSQLIDGLFAASIRNAFTLWIMMNGALLVVISLMENQISPGSLGMFLLMSASTMFAALGVALRIAVWPSMAKRLTVLFVSCIVFLGPMVAWWNLRETVGDWPFAVAALVVVVLGAGLIYEARRAWLRLEAG